MFHQWTFLFIGLSLQSNFISFFIKKIQMLNTHQWLFFRRGWKIIENWIKWRKFNFTWHISWYFILIVYSIFQKCWNLCTKSSKWKYKVKPSKKIWATWRSKLIYAYIIKFIGNTGHIRLFPLMYIWIHLQ